jgi:hypothetical protein
MPLPLADFHSRLLEAGVLTPEQLLALESLLEGKSAPLTGDDLARLLVSRQVLTAYQAQSIYQGKVKQLVLEPVTKLVFAS